MSGTEIRIAVFDDYLGTAPEYFPHAELSAEFGAETVFYRDHLDSIDDVVARANDADVLVVMRERTRFPAAVIDRLVRPRLIVTTGARNAAIDEEAARRRGIAVCGAGGTDSATSELTWALLMALVRRIPSEDAGVRSGEWGRHMGDHLRGRTLGIVGLGTIGSEVARYGAAFGMHVVATGLTLTKERAALHGCEMVSWEGLFRQADIVSVHLRLTEQTRGSIGWREFGIMGAGSYLVNTARGELIDESALVAALQGRKIRGAALDVHAVEPLPSDSPFLTMDNVVLTPHIGYVTEQRYATYYGQAGETVAWFLRGRPIRVIV
jgi:phosphoglycerate dehydrogenase-like enzyme